MRYLTLALLLVASPCQALMLPCQFTVDGAWSGSWSMDSDMIPDASDIIGGTEGAITRPGGVSAALCQLDWTFEGKHWDSSNSTLSLNFIVHDGETYVNSWLWTGADGDYSYNLSGKWTPTYGFVGTFTRTDTQGHLYSSEDLEWGYEGTPTPDPGPLDLAVAFAAAKQAPAPAPDSLELVMIGLLIPLRRKRGS